MRREITVTRNKDGYIDIRIFCDGRVEGVTLTKEEATELKLAVGKVVDDGAHREKVPFRG